MLVVAIIGAVAAIGGAIINMVGSNNVADAQREIAARQEEMTKIQADTNRYITDQEAINTQTALMMDVKKQESFSAGLQTGLLVLAIVVVGIIFVIKKNKQ